MKKKIVSLSLASLLTGPSLVCVQNMSAIDDDSIILESPILHMFDGTSLGIDADVIESIGFIRKKINKILIGEKKADGSLVGQYTINGKQYSVKELAHLETEFQFFQAELELVLERARKDLQACVEPFMERIHSVKYQILELIRESCKKRGTETSILLRWSEAADGEEPKIFRESVTSFTLLDQFCTDLLNFLGDLMRSCPRSMAQLRIRMDKFQKARTLLKNIINTRYGTQTAENAIEQKFLRYLKEQHLDKLSITEITKERLESLFTKFIHQKK